jgi:uncharacterized protein YjbI with pentapeptide repeats
LPTPARALLFLVPAIATAALVALHPSPAHAARRRLVSARAIVKRIERGRPVRENHVEVRGTLRLPATVSAPVVFHNSIINGSISGPSTTFDQVLVLSDTKVTGSLDLPYSNFRSPVLLLTTRVGRARFDFASFDESALLVDSSFTRGGLFEGSFFGGPVRFARSTFGGHADFDLATFDDLGVFETTQFNGPASFAHAEFRSHADFVAALFGGHASFAAASFFQGADYTGANFLSQATFEDAQFEQDTAFRETFFTRRASFAGATATALLDFDGAQFQGPLEFSTTHLADAEFSGGASFAKPVDFDQATIDSLDLDGAVIHSTLHFPLPGAIGAITKLRMDPGDVAHIEAVARIPQHKAHIEREHALAMIESAARSDGDLAEANDAEVRRLTLGRQDRSAFGSGLDWTFEWQIGGYLVSPLHPFLALVALVFLAALIRSWKGRGDLERAGLGGRVRGFAEDLRKGLSALWTFDPGGGGFFRFVEQLATKVLVVVLVLSIGNVAPGLSPIVKGVLP